MEITMYGAWRYLCLSPGSASQASPVTSVGLSFSIFRMITSRFYPWTVWPMDLFVQKSDYSVLFSLITNEGKQSQTPIPLRQQLPFSPLPVPTCSGAALSSGKFHLSVVSHNSGPDDSETGGLSASGDRSTSFLWRTSSSSGQASGLRPQVSLTLCQHLR